MKLPSKVRAAGLVALSGFLVGSLSAQVTFTLNATARWDLWGYTAGQSAVFSFVVADSFPTFWDNAPIQPAFSSSSNLWGEVDAENSPLWVSVSGTGLTGTFVASNTGEMVRPSIYVQKSEAEFDFLSFSAANTELTGSMGLLLPDGVTALRSLSVSLERTRDFSYPEHYVSPADYFAVYAGTYTPEPPYSTIEVIPVGAINGSQLFTVNSLTISSGALVPEPSAYGLMAGMLGFGVAFVVRSRRRLA